VVEPTISGVHDLERIMGTTDHFGVPSLVAINKADLNLARCEEIAAFCAEQGVQVVGQIPYDNVVTEAMVQGQPVTAYTDGPVTEALKELWSRLRDSIVSRGDLSTSHRRNSL
jgi:MinD superfamily P-loop ATPase